MDSLTLAVFKDGVAIAGLRFNHTPEIAEINQFVELSGGDSGRLLNEKEVIVDGEIVELTPPYPSWLWNSTTRTFEAPVPMPPLSDGPRDWDEATRSWIIPL